MPGRFDDVSAYIISHVLLLLWTFLGFFGIIAHWNTILEQTLFNHSLHFCSCVLGYGKAKRKLFKCQVPLLL